MAKCVEDIVVAQLTDLHVGPESDHICAGNADRLARCVRRIDVMRRRPDLVLLTGDLTEYGDEASLNRVLASVSQLGLPVCVALGNHDVIDVPAHEVRQRYDLSDRWESQRAGSLRVLCADTSETGRHGGAFDASAARELGRRLNETPDTPTLLAIHHPPCPVGIGWMDPQDDAPWINSLGDVVQDAPSLIGIVCGHVHVPAVTMFAGVRLFVSPAVASQSHIELAPIDAQNPDGRPLIVAAPPAFALHRFSPAGWTSLTITVDAPRALVSHTDTAAALLRSVKDILP